MREIREGLRAPAFCLEDDEMQKHCLKDFKGK